VIKDGGKHSHFPLFPSGKQQASFRTRRIAGYKRLAAAIFFIKTDQTGCRISLEACAVIRTILSMIIGTFLLFSASDGSAACSYNCKKTEIKDLVFGLQSKGEQFYSMSMRNKLFFPENKNERHGVIIILHACAGLNAYAQRDIIRWGELFLKNNYAVLVIDHLDPRNVSKNCWSKGGRALGSSVLVKDVYSAIAFLNKQPAIDTSRVFSVGFSLGAMTSGALASEGRYKQLGNNGPRPRAVAGLYGGCYSGEKWLEGDGDIPVLWLAGGKDTESPLGSCASAINSMKKKGLITVHKYPTATHCWDCFDLNGFTKKAGNRNKVTYIYDAEVTKDSEQRVLNFFNSFQSQ
jgi:dienelactone hydrolase